MCAAKRAREDATALRGILGELRRQGGHAYLVTLTVPHAIHHDIRDTRKTVAKAWTSVSNGTPWKRFCGTYHVAGVARALEVTHGANGWHPHAHVLLFCRRVLSAGELAECAPGFRSGGACTSKNGDGPGRMLSTASP